MFAYSHKFGLLYTTVFNYMCDNTYINIIYCVCIQVFTFGTVLRC